MKNEKKIIYFSLIFAVLLLNVCLAEDLVPFSSNGKWGYADESMNIVISPQWDTASNFRCGKTAIVGILQEDGDFSYGLINQNGEYIVPCDYHILDNESEVLFGGEDGYYLIWDKENKLCGYYDIKYNYYCSPKYRDVDIGERTEKNIISVMDPVTRLRGYIYSDTEMAVSEFCYIETGPFIQDAAIAIALDAQWIQFIDGTRKKISDEYSVNLQIVHGVFIVTNRDYKYGLMDLNCELVTKEWYDMIYIENTDEIYGIINKEHVKIVID